MQYIIDTNLLTGTVVGTAGLWNSATNVTNEVEFDFDQTTFLDVLSDRDAMDGKKNKYSGLVPNQNAGEYDPGVYSLDISYDETNYNQIDYF